MKKPEEIKKGLECVSTLVPIYEDCGECPYAVDSESFAVCGQMVSADALAYIQQLEEKATLYDEAVADALQFEKERDAAVNCIARTCTTCAHLNVDDVGIMVCQIPGGCSVDNEWQWRGAQEVE